MGLFDKFLGKSSPPIGKEGDVFHAHHQGKCHVKKLLAVDAAHQTYHVLIYEPVHSPPTLAEVAKLQVQIYHAPFDAKAFAQDKLIGNLPVTVSDLKGYHSYLRMTGQVQEAARRASALYKDAYALTDQGRIPEAVERYEAAIELIPEFHEAIDNLGIILYEQKRYEEAMARFGQSLEVNPRQMLPTMAIVSCLYFLERWPECVAQLEAGRSIDPRHPKVHFYTELLRKEGRL